MKPDKNIEKLVRLEKPQVTTGDAMDERTLNNSFEVMDETIRNNKKCVAGIILRSRVAKLAAVAVIILAVSLLLVYRNPTEQQQPPKQVPSVSKSPAEMLTPISLRNAYLVGGMEAVDEQSRKAFQMLNRKPAKVSICQLQIEANGM
jgi:hypothetical protein